MWLYLNRMRPRRLTRDGSHIRYLAGHGFHAPTGSNLAALCIKRRGRRHAAPPKPVPGRGPGEQKETVCSETWKQSKIWQLTHLSTLEEKTGDSIQHEENCLDWTTDTYFLSSTFFGWKCNYVWFGRDTEHEFDLLHFCMTECLLLVWG